MSFLVKALIFIFGHFTNASKMLHFLPLHLCPDTAVPPWVGFNEEEQMKAQILELSAVSLSIGLSFQPVRLSVFFYLTGLVYISITLSTSHLLIYQSLSNTYEWTDLHQSVG